MIIAGLWCSVLYSFHVSADDSAAHISEETAGAARAAPIAIMTGVGLTASLGWLLYIAVSYATFSVADIIQTDLPLPMGQLFLNTLGKRGMLAIWSLIIVVQVGSSDLYSSLRLIILVLFYFYQYVTGAAQGVDASRVVFAFARDNALPGSRWWKKMNPYTQTPVNAAWLVMVLSGICGVLGFSETALTSLAGYVLCLTYLSLVHPALWLQCLCHRSLYVLRYTNLPAHHLWPR